MTPEEQEEIRLWIEAVDKMEADTLGRRWTETYEFIERLGEIKCR